MTAVQLKTSILQLAIEGKLVEQDPADEPVSVTPFEGEVPFDVPENWVWARLGDTFDMQSGKFIKASDIHQDNKSTRFPCYGGNGLRGYVDSYNTEGTFPLIGRQGALCGNINMASGKFYATEHAVVTKPKTSIDVYWAAHVLTAMNLNQYSTATAQPGLAVGKISTVPIPIPPLPEQQRIVAKLESLLPHIAEYGAAESRLTALNEGFPAALKKSILQAAVQGKLVEQDPHDEPVDVQEYKGEVPFDVPEGWKWAKVEDISTSYIGLTYKPTDVVVSGGSIVLRSSNIQGGKLVLDDIVRVNCNITSKLRVQKNDIIICARNGSKRLVGKSAIVNVDRDDLTFGAFMAICKTQHYQFMYVFLQSDLFFGQLVEVSGTTTINQLTQNSFNKFLIPLPPLAEQKRIVARVDELLAAVEGGNNIYEHSKSD